MGERAPRPLTGGPNRVGLAVGLVLGFPVMAVGVIGLVRHTDASPPRSYLTFLVGGDLVHDLVLAPVAAGIAVLVLRRLPDRLRGPVRAGLFASAVVLAIAWPALRMYGRMRAPDNPSVQPLDYATAVATVLFVVWLVVAAWSAAAVLRSRPEEQPGAQVSRRNDS